jgi:uncharacterized protein YbjT (DUF2867 family)
MAAVLITGGTGFVGSRIAARLLRQGSEVRVLARGPADVPGAEVVHGDVTDPDSLSQGFEGCRAVIHLVGIIREAGRVTFERVHVQGTANVIEACRKAGVARLIHMSALGVRSGAPTAYYRSKWRAEGLVRASGLNVTIFRPSVIFGPGSGFLKEIRGIVEKAPVLPIIGRGTSLLQPIWVEDVATCFAKAIGMDRTAGQTYELGGPEVYGFEQLLDLVAAAEGIEKPKIHLPVWLVRIASEVLSRVSSRFPLTPDELTMLLEDNVCDIAEMKHAFSVQPAPLTKHLSD